MKETSLGHWVTRVDAAAFERLVVVSPHFDDAVLGCGQLLAAHAPANVVTVMGGARPDGYADVTWWDALGGFKPGDDVAAARRAEDVAALDVLGATSGWLDFSDHQYDKPEPGADRPAVSTVAAALLARLESLDPTLVVIPMGLANPDHVLTHDACLEVFSSDAGRRWPWLAYAEAGYSALPEVLSWRLRTLRSSGVVVSLAPVSTPDHREAKRQALQCYSSQLPALAEDWGYDVSSEIGIPESLWTLTPRPAEWGSPA